jgi:periplasmic protein TonB
MRRQHVASRVFNPGALVGPHVIPRQVGMIAENAPASPADAALSASHLLGDLPGGMSGVVADRIGIGVPPSSPASTKEDVKPAKEQPLPVSSSLQSAKLMKHPMPVYPTIAKSAHIQGTVVLQAIIGKDGTVQNITVIRAASSLLISAARDAVKQWVYQPTLLNQQPVEVISEITIVFSLQ